ncbi:uncharacterized protein [Typha latifolia]|uniref:uncharacterized protein n=1 Tax=Typha latifolia TaxID=4733 RepID=UPI003C309182
MKRSPGMGGESMLRTVARVVGAGVGGLKEPAISAPARGTKPAAGNARVVRVSSSPTSPTSSPTFSSAAAAGLVGNWKASPCFGDGEEWETVDREEEMMEEVVEMEGGGRGFEVGGFGFPERLVFGKVPSREEVEDAVSSLQQIFVPVTFSGVQEAGYPSFSDQGAVDKKIVSEAASGGSSELSTESDWIEPSMHLYSSGAFQSEGREKVLDAFHLLQINPSIQKMVVSLSSDKAVWDAVMKNEIVQELKKSFCEDAVGVNEPQDPDECPDSSTRFLRWIFSTTKTKIVEFFDNIMKLVNEFFHPQTDDSEAGSFDDAVRSSFMLSVLVFLIVVMTRVQRA